MSLTGRIAWQEHLAGRRPATCPAAARCRTPRSGGELIVDAAPARARRRRGRRRRGRRGELHRRSGRAPCRSTRRAAGRRLRHVEDTRGGAPRAPRHRRAGRRLRAAARCATGSGAPAARRRRPATIRSATCSTSQHDEPEVARAARWYLEPVDYLTMRFTGVAAATHASMIAAWLTDNRAPRPARLRLRPRARGRRRRGQAAAAAADRLGRRRRCAPTSPPRSASRRRRRWSPARPICTPPPPAPAPCATSRPTSRSAPPSWIGCPVPFKKTDVAAPDRQRPRPAPRPLPGRQQPRDRRPVPALAARRTSLGDGARLRAELDGASPAAPRPGSGDVLFTPWLAGERSPVDDRRARGGFHNLSLATTPRRPRARRARGRRLQQPLAARGGRALRRPAPRSDPHHRRRRAVGPLVPDPRRRHGPHHRARRRAAARQPARRRADRRHRARRARARARCGRWSAPTRPSSPTPATAPSTTGSTPSSRSSTGPSARCSDDSTARRAP